MCRQTDIHKQVARLAERWMRQCGMTLQMRDRLRMVDAAVGRADMTPEQRGLLAAACDLYDMLAATPEGRQALLDLGFEPLPQHPKGE